MCSNLYGNLHVIESHVILEECIFESDLNWIIKSKYPKTTINSFSLTTNKLREEMENELLNITLVIQILIKFASNDFNLYPSPL